MGGYVDKMIRLRQRHADAAQLVREAELAVLRAKEAKAPTSGEVEKLIAAQRDSRAIRLDIAAEEQRYSVRHAERRAARAAQAVATPPVPMTVRVRSTAAKLLGYMSSDQEVPGERDVRLMKALADFLTDTETATDDSP